MTAALLAGVAGLALLDALNPATIAGVALLLLAPMAHPVRAAAGLVAGAYLTVLGLGAVVYVGADTAADAAGNGLVWVRRVAFTGRPWRWPCRVCAGCGHGSALRSPCRAGSTR